MSTSYSVNDNDHLLGSSPYKVIRGKEFQVNMDNSSPESLKLQLQNQYSTQLQELNERENSANLNEFYGELFRGTYNGQLQRMLEEEKVSIENSKMGLSSNGSTKEDDSGSSTDPSDVEIGDTFEGKPNYVDLKVLMENAILSASKEGNKNILSLPAFKKMKHNLESKIEMRGYLSSKLTISKDFMSGILTNPKMQEQLEIDNAFLLKYLQSNIQLQDQLLDITNDIEHMTYQLNDHTLNCLALEYVNDIRYASMNTSNKVANIGSANTAETLNPTDPASGSVQKSFDSLFSFIASIAVQKDVHLPPPATDKDSSNLSAHIEWAQKCISSIIFQQEASGANHVEKMASNLTTDENAVSVTDKEQSSFLKQSDSKSIAETEKQINELKTALGDLRFSHQYLTKELEYSRASSMKTIQEYRKKINSLERELLKARELNKSNAIIISNDANAKDKEVSRLRAELDLLKIDALGQRNSAVQSSMHDSINCSPISSLAQYDIDKQASDSGSFQVRPSSFGNSMSTGILKEEFKKIVEEIHDQYQLELGEERLKRRKAEEDLRLLNNRQF